MTLNACVIFGDDSNTQLAIIRWKIGEPEYDHGPRCLDRDACRARVEAAGEAWNVVDSKPPEPMKERRR